MLLASKLEDHFPIPLNVFVERVALGRFTNAEIVEREREMLDVLHFDVTFATVHDFLEDLLTEFVAQDDDQLLETTFPLTLKLREYGLFYAMMAAYDYRMLSYAYLIPSSL